MTSQSQPVNQKILELIGAIVLTSQDAERYLKLTLPFMGAESGKSPSLGATMGRHRKLQKRTLGDLAGKLVESSTCDSLKFSSRLANLVSVRNRIVHQFYETYGEDLQAGRHLEVLGLLESHLSSFRALRSALEKLALAMLEGLRDATFQGTEEYAQFADLCASFRAQVAVSMSASSECLSDVLRR